MTRRRRPPRPGALTELPPLKILRQIVLLQTIWYTSGAILILFTALVAGRKFSFDLVLSWRGLRGDTTVGWMLGVVWLLNCLVGVISLLLLIARSKLVPDFVFTLHFVHLVITSLYSKTVPRNWLWWTLQFASAALMTSLGVWSCRWRELRPITFGGTGSGTTQQNISRQGENAADGEGEGGDEELEYGRGRGRGRGRDGGGEYEMVGMKGESDSAG